MYSGGGVTGMAALKRRRTLLLSLNMTVMPPYRSAFRFIGRDGLADPGGAVDSISRAWVRRRPVSPLRRGNTQTHQNSTKLPVASAYFSRVLLCNMVYHSVGFLMPPGP